MISGALSAIEAGLLVLSDKEHDVALDEMKRTTTSLHRGLDLILEYLRKRQEMGKSGDKGS
jgi:hypothetical protein